MTTSVPDTADSAATAGGGGMPPTAATVAGAGPVVATPPSAAVEPVTYEAADLRMPLADAAAVVLGRPVEVVRTLPGGTHAETAVVRAGDRELVARRFPPGDPAAEQELTVLPLLAPLGAIVPALVAHGVADGDGVLVTSVVDGGPPDPSLEPVVMAARMAAVLARIHRLDPTPLRQGEPRIPEQHSAIAQAARDTRPHDDHGDEVFAHGDFWCGNLLWRGDRVTGVVDWSGARRYPRGGDVAWCRQDLVLLGAPEAARVFLRAYEEASGTTIANLREWDIRVGAYAEQVVETWAPNYEGIGRPDDTAEVLRARLDAWNAALLDG